MLIAYLLLVTKYAEHRVDKRLKLIDSSFTSIRFEGAGFKKSLNGSIKDIESDVCLKSIYSVKKYCLFYNAYS